MAIRLGATSYSYQEELRLGLMTLEDVMASLAAVGGTGFEIIPEQVLGRQFMHLTDGFVREWFELLAKYDLTPTCADIFDDFNLYRNRTLSLSEQLDQMRHYLEVAKALGFTSVRVLANTPVPVLTAALPMAEYYGVKLGLEVHAPLTLRSTWAESWIEAIDRAGSKFGGFIPDFGIFGLRPLTLNVKRAIRDGADPAICDFIVGEYRKNAKKRAETAEVLTNASPEEMMRRGAYGSEELEEKVRKMGGGRLELGLVNARLSYDDPQWVVDVLDYVVHVHAKFYDMVPDGKGGYTDPNIDTETIVRALRDAGYDGYLSSEYEGMGFFRTPGDPEYPDACEQIRRHHVMIRSILNEKYTGLLARYGR